MKSSRKKRGLAALAVFAVFGGLLVWAAPTAITQEGQKNYIGNNCPGPEWNCDTPDDNGNVIEAVQKAPTGGINRIECPGSICNGDQVGLNGGEPTNEATCDNSVSDQKSEQLCDFHQDGSSNKITATLEASPSAPVAAANVDQRSEHRVLTSQIGDTNELTVNSSIDQFASIVDTTVNVNHLQCTYVHTDNLMEATSTNVATFNLNRNQTSNATGRITTQNQDSAACPTEPDGTKVGLADIDLVANSGGTQSISFDGTDAKDENGTAALGDANQVQGYTGAGWDTTFAMNTGVSGGAGNPDLKIGTPDLTKISNPSDGGGMGKQWIQSAIAPAGQVHQTMDDGLPIKIPGSGSMKRGQTNSWCDLRSGPAATIVANASLTGFAAENLDFRMACNMLQGDDAAKFDEAQQGVQGSFAFNSNCNVDEASDEECQGVSGGQSDSHAHLGVRKVNEDPYSSAEDQSARNATSALPGETVQYHASFHNTGGAAAQSAKLTLPFAAKTTVVAGCDAGCTQTGAYATGGTVTWDLDTVGPGEFKTRTLDVQIGADREPGDITTSATRLEAGEDPLDSNPVTVTVESPPPPTIKKVIISFPQPIKARTGVWPVIMKAIQDSDESTVDDPANELTGVNPVTICVGKAPPDGGLAPGSPSPAGVPYDCSEAHGFGTIHREDFDGDGDRDVVFHFNANETGFKKGDLRAYVTGRLLDGTWIEGWSDVDGLEGAPVKVS